MLNHIELSYVHQTYWDRTIGLDTMDIQTTDFDISEAKKNIIIENAYITTKKYLKNKTNCKKTKTPEPMRASLPSLSVLHAISRWANI